MGASTHTPTSAVTVGRGCARRAGPASKAGITCPYHAWTYSLDGRLIGTPHLAADEIDRGALSLWSIACEVWEGFVFVNLSADPIPLLDWFASGMDTARRFEHLHLGELRTAVTTSTDVGANWKILVENYQECLHCSWVHPELVDLVPLYKTGSVVDPTRIDGGVNIRGNSFSLTGVSDLPRAALHARRGDRVVLRRDRVSQHVHRCHRHLRDRVVDVAEERR